jgi:hypothetical protein
LTLKLARDAGVHGLPPAYWLSAAIGGGGVVARRRSVSDRA